MTSSGRAKIIRKLQNHASKTVNVTKILCLNQFPYLYKTVDEIKNESSILKIRGV